MSVTYVMHSRAHMNRYKIGWSSGSAEDRIRRASARTWLPDLRIVTQFKGEGRGLEKFLHKRLAAYRVGTSEWFDLDPQGALGADEVWTRIGSLVAQFQASCL